MPNTVYQATIFQTMYGQSIQNVLHFSHFSSDPATMQTLAQSLEINFSMTMKFMQTSWLKHNNIQVRMLDSQFSPFNWAVNVDGTRENDTSYTTFDAIVMKWITETHGRHGRGRMFIGGIPRNFYDKGFLNNTAITECNNRIVTWMNHYGPNGSTDFRIGITRKTNPTDNFIPITNMTFNTHPCVQRRRNIGTGI